MVSQIPGTVVVVFTSKLRAEAQGYEEAAGKMVELAQTQPGFLDIASVREENGFGITVCFWRDEESVQSFRDHLEHKAAQESGKRQWYESYTITVAQVMRSYGSDEHRS